MQRNKKLSNDKTSTSGFVHNKPKEPSLWFVNELIVCIAVLYELPLSLDEFGVGVIDIVIIIAADNGE